ncbi:hypothetical protein B0G80_6847 [Paraburkholderia sp. BL6669N2]|nr:hypothetical protein B0G80_6847 [Paraburkholderia sp. BL6669N2]
MSRLSRSPPLPRVGYRVLYADMGLPGCSISLKDFYGGHVESGANNNAWYWTDKPPVRSTLGPRLLIEFACGQANEGYADAQDKAQMYGASWDSTKGWAPYYVDDSEKKLLSPVTRIYQLKSENSNGFIRTRDDINGEERLRVRSYKYCLFHDDKAICGAGQTMRLSKPAQDYLPLILRILRSVRFVDVPSSEDKRND